MTHHLHKQAVNTMTTLSQMKSTKDEYKGRTADDMTALIRIKSEHGHTMQEVADHLGLTVKHVLFANFIMV